MRNRLEAARLTDQVGRACTLPGGRGGTGRSWRCTLHALDEDRVWYESFTFVVVHAEHNSV